MKNNKLVMIMYSLGYLGISIFTQVTVKWYQYFYTPPEANIRGLSVLIPVGFIMLWFPPVNGESITNFIYLTTVLSLFFIFFTIVVAPYLALINEISGTNKERISLTTMQGITQIIGVMIAEVGSGFIIDIYNFREGYGRQFEKLTIISL